MRCAVLVLAVGAVAVGAAPSRQTPALQQRSSSPDQTRDNPGKRIGTSIVRGRVVADGLDVRPPIPNARVAIGGPAGALDPVFTDPAGRFEFTALPAGRYTLIAEKTGYAKTQYGSKSDLEPPFAVEIADAAIVDAIELRLPKGAAIAGRVVDALGDPVVGAPVSVGLLQRSGSQSRLVNVVRPASDTNDLGEYRIGGLQAGWYYVSVAGGSEGSMIAGMPIEWARTSGWSRTFYQAASSLVSASPLVLAAGEERGGIDFTLAPVRSATLSVTLSDAGGAPASGLVNLMLAQDGVTLANRGLPFAPDFPKRTMTLDPGEWIAVAMIENAVVGLTHVTLASGEDASLVLAPMRGARIAGRVLVEGAAAPPPLASIRLDVRAVGAYANVPRAQRGPVTVKPDGSFEMNNQFGTVEIQAVAPRGWTIKSVRRGDRDLMDEPLTLRAGEEIGDLLVVLTDELADLAGVAVDADGRPSPGCQIALFPDSGDMPFGSRRVRLLRADSNGRFTTSELLAGSYLAAASPDVDAAVWQTFEYLDRLRPIATHLTLSGREQKKVSLRCMSMR